MRRQLQKFLSRDKIERYAVSDAVSVEDATRVAQSRSGTGTTVHSPAGRPVIVAFLLRQVRGVRTLPVSSNPKAMMRNRSESVGSPSPAANSSSQVHRAGRELDETPPPDFDAYLEVRDRGLRATRRRLEERRRRK